MLTDKGSLLAIAKVLSLELQSHQVPAWYGTNFTFLQSSWYKPLDDYADLVWAISCSVRVQCLERVTISVNLAALDYFWWGGIIQFEERCRGT